MRMKKKRLLIIALTLTTLGYGVFLATNPQNKTSEYPQEKASQPSFNSLEKPEGWIVAAGKVEPVSETINLAFELNGIIDEILVKEGDVITIGQLLATLKSGEREARQEASKSELEAQKAVHEKLVTGARKEEKNEAWAILEQARIDRNNAKVEADRRKKLLKQELIAEEDVDRAIKDSKVATNRFEEARQRYLITLTQSRKEDIRKAFAQLQTAQSQVEEMTHELEKAKLRSPIDGTVLRRHKHAGERVSIFLPGPVLTIGDINRLNVRAEVLEKDIAHIKIGTPVSIRTNAFANTNFTGKIIHISPEMGEKAIYSEKPEELLDTKVLEIVIALESPDGLIPKLDVDVFIPIGDATAP